jgi:murein DD-endopeptidase MepM/ murein hydrolase activator NlpD
LAAAGLAIGLCLLAVFGVLSAVGGGGTPVARLVGSRSRGIVRVWQIVYRSHTGAERAAYVDLPAWYGPADDPPLPLIISPHGRGAIPAANSALWGSLPALGRFAVVNPEGQGRRLTLFSWGDPGQIADLARMPKFVRIALPWLRIARGRVYAFGGSMGGQEALLVAARYPHLLAGAAAFDAPVDVARRYYDFRLLRCRGRCPEVSDDVSAPVVQQLAQFEIGGTPTTAARAYAERSPLTYARELAFSHVPLQIWWSRADRVVVDGGLQSGLLYGRIKQLNPRAPVMEAVGSWRHDADMNAHTKLPAALLAFGLLPLPRGHDTGYQRRPKEGLGIRRTATVAVRCKRTVGGVMGTLAGRLPDYSWPLAPFRIQHAVRGNFGDPRTLFLLSDPASNSPAGTFTFHNGVDIVGAVGQPVYPVESGRVVVARRDRIYVQDGDRLFGYWHLLSAARLGEQVVAHRTVLGFIRPKWRHVHFEESIYGRQINPLLHLTPYTDSQPPTVSGLRFTDPNGQTLDPQRLHGRVTIAAGAYDMPAEHVPSAWSGMPVTPALVRWQLSTISGRALLRASTAADFRVTIPQGDPAFWRVYAPGTYQNFPTIGLHLNFQQPGNYLFDLTPKPLDTDRLAPGHYLVRVTAADICGNTTSYTQKVGVRSLER